MSFCGILGGYKEARAVNGSRDSGRTAGVDFYEIISETSPSLHGHQSIFSTTEKVTLESRIMDTQIVSKERVTDRGEVFTAEREVNAMLDLVSQEAERFDARFLEPACGNGNFLAPILKRKLGILKRRYAKSQIEFERYGVIAVGSIYGIDIDEDNVRSCRHRLLTIFMDTYSSLFRVGYNRAYVEAVTCIFEKNIILGDARTLKTIGGQPITFSEWSLISGSMIKRRDFTFEELLPKTEKQTGLFAKTIVSDTGKSVYIPIPTGEYPVVHYVNLAHEYAN